jgi:hypothetical protein
LEAKITGFSGIFPSILYDKPQIYFNKKRVPFGQSLLTIFEDFSPIMRLKGVKIIVIIIVYKKNEILKISEREKRKVL